ncbi:restriction endonuclease [Dactylosporangium sp. CS-033363]|uniref:nSTAND1 domain-containing NTPase n=1 Tax=Dactylosporangium sp. CS-033363 TaxID=3239935 RepID=UPI003D94E8DE
MQRLPIPDARVLVLVDGDGGLAAHKAGHLFEDFIARLMALYGYEEPTNSKLRTTSRGIELDVSLRHRMANHRAIAECKAYSSPVKSEMLVQFFGALTVERISNPELHGYFVALPRLTAEGDEKARQIMEGDSRFKVLTADDVVLSMRQQSLIVDIPVDIGPIDDHAVAITEHGLYSCAIQLDPQTRTAQRVVVWGATTPVPLPVLDLVAASPGYGDGIEAVDLSVLRDAASVPSTPEHEPVIATVAGSESDFEYQLPASPRFFIGRSPVISELESVVSRGGNVIVLNAQSGWGKSSLALRLKALVGEKEFGHAVVADARTATTKAYLTTVLRRAALEAQAGGVLSLPPDAAWATLASALATLSRADWVSTKRLVVFFDQFENVFKDPVLTREFRDLALGARECGGGLVVGFAWKTDLVGWTEGHPYQLRDEIRANAVVVTLEPLGPREVDTLLRRLEKALGQRLVPDLRQRLREYSQGLPWLLKKLCGHLIREARAGVTQERLLAEALNIQNLFEADLAELQPVEQDALKYVARFAPVAASEVTDRVPPPVIQSLLDRRLIVQVGERLDTYWDTFRDFLNTGRVPVEDTYILRLPPASVARLLAVLPPDGNGSVPEIAARWGTSDKAVFNVSRELRLLGITVYESNRVRVAAEIWSAADREDAIRRRVASSLRRHRAYGRLLQMAERGSGRVSLASYARDLPSIFPAVSPDLRTWPDHARAFARWFEYAGLVRISGQIMEITPEGDIPAEVRILGVRPVARLGSSFPHEAPGPALSALKSIAAQGPGAMADAYAGKHLRELLKVGAISITQAGGISIADGLVVNEEIDPSRLRDLLNRLPGCGDAMRALDENPALKPTAVGAILSNALGAEWSDGTLLSTGKYMRAWARAAGIKTSMR